MMNFICKSLLTTALISGCLLGLTGCTAGYVKPGPGSPTMAQVYEMGMHRSLNE